MIFAGYWNVLQVWLEVYGVSLEMIRTGSRDFLNEMVVFI